MTRIILEDCPECGARNSKRESPTCPECGALLEVKKKKRFKIKGRCFKRALRKRQGPGNGLRTARG